MGHRKNRKRERKSEQRAWNPDSGPKGLATYVDKSDEFDAIIDNFDMYQSRINLPVKQCGNCREFLEDEHGGRGECLHPGSGILRPWTDTASCDFYARRR